MPGMCVSLDQFFPVHNFSAHFSPAKSPAGSRNFRIPKSNSFGNWELPARQSLGAGGEFGVSPKFFRVLLRSWFCPNQFPIIFLSAKYVSEFQSCVLPRLSFHQ